MDFDTQVFRSVYGGFLMLGVMGVMGVVYSYTQSDGIEKRTR